MPLCANPRHSGTVLASKCPFAKKKVLDVNTQACAVAIARFDPTPIMQETPESEKHNAGTDTNIGNVNLFDFQNESRFEVAAHWYKFNGDDE